ncbi:hypothetical protein A5635_00710 [Mycobacterium asiaticum]|uniref:DUF1275 family protein n=1 Tax=Mycobacterium asiaticum TaxID=1790 RepID=A0A1A3P1F0_MYCAS|nr:hypothetical protein A5635_00710 [Mycobacterium asiaticum]OBK94245.1 hypothetical protein A5645_17370 [Mycobacterium asiaticum]
MHPPSHVLGYCAALALTAGFVNAVALLILAVPVGNLTGVTTQLGMDAANPWRYESHVLIAILLGFLAGATVAGALITSTQAPRSGRHATVLVMEAVLLLLAAAGVEAPPVQAQLSSLGVEGTAVQALLAAAALGLQNGLTSSFRGMSVRTTHFTGTVTDLGLMLGRSRQLGVDRWKVAILAMTLLAFLGGGVIGILAAAHLGGYALLVPVAICMSLAGVNLAQGRSQVVSIVAAAVPGAP